MYRGKIYRIRRRLCIRLYPVYSDRYYGKREYDSERVKYHIPTVYYDNKRRVKRVSYHAMQCMNINRGDKSVFVEVGNLAVGSEVNGLFVLEF